MGGYLSGGHNSKGRPKVEEFKKLKIQKVVETGLLDYPPNQAECTIIINNSVEFMINRNTVSSIKMICESKDVAYELPYIKKARNFGGHQYYWQCPTCSNLRQYFLVRNEKIYCRGCANFNYYLRSAGNLDRICHNIDKIKKELGNEEISCFEIECEKPKGMHQSTFERKYNRLKKYCLDLQSLSANRGFSF